MTDMTFDYTEAQRELDRVGLLADDKSRARVAKVQAQATVDIAISLSIIAELMQADRTPVKLALMDEPVDESDDVTPEPTEDARDAEPGDTVSVKVSDILGVKPSVLEVLEVGSTEGEVWLKLAGAKGKKWARDYVIVERGVGGDFA